MIFSVVFAVVAIVIAGLWIARLDSAMQAQNRYTAVSGVNKPIMIYDVACYVGPFRNDESVAEVAEDAKDCLQDKDCRDAGSNWSGVFLFNAIIMIALILNMVCIGLGGCIPLFRIIGAYAAMLLCVLHLVVIIMTAVYRYNAMG